LQNVVERAVIVSRGPILNVPLCELKPDIVPMPPTGVSENLRNLLSETERTEILRALEASNWVVSGPNGAAARLGVKRTTLQIRMKRLGIRVLRTPVDEPESGQFVGSPSPYRRVLNWPGSTASSANPHVGFRIPQPASA
jgi:formate hydrogenlyase transcriptional activator